MLNPLTAGSNGKQMVISKNKKGKTKEKTSPELSLCFDYTFLLLLIQQLFSIQGLTRQSLTKGMKKHRYWCIV